MRCKDCSGFKDAPTSAATSSRCGRRRFPLMTHRQHGGRVSATEIGKGMNMPAFHSEADIFVRGQKRSFDHLVGTNASSHSGNPTFRSPSINSFTCDRLTRPILADIVKAGSTSSIRATASRASALRPRWAKGGRETAVSCRIRGVLTKGFLPRDDGLVKAAKLNKGAPNSGECPV